MSPIYGSAFFRRYRGNLPSSLCWSRPRPKLNATISPVSVLVWCKDPVSCPWDDPIRLFHFIREVQPMAWDLSFPLMGAVGLPLRDHLPPDVHQCRGTFEIFGPVHSLNSNRYSCQHSHWRVQRIGITPVPLWFLHAQIPCACTPLGLAPE